MAEEEDDPDRLQPRLERWTVDPALLRDLRTAGERKTGARRAPSGMRSGMRSFGGTVGAEAADPEPTVRVIIELDPDWPGGTAAARASVYETLGALGSRDPATVREGSGRYVFAELTVDHIARLAGQFPAGRASPMLRLWRDQPLYPLLDKSIRTVKADACMVVFGADGADIVVAVADSGIDADHPHFAEYQNLRDLPAGVAHRDFTGENAALVDGYGHGTHVAGIVAGRTAAATMPIARVAEWRDLNDAVTTTVSRMPVDTVLRGVAPRTKLVSLKVLDSRGRGYSSALIEALEHVHEVNDAGRRIRIHCVNLSLGYPFEAEWFAAGHSPLCEVVNRLSRSGVVVVAAAGNDGSMLMQTEGRSDRQRIGLDQSINDPGNADEAITVGATHAESPHAYGVSYFSSRGPTADGRVKPDLVAPGERILSCAPATSSKLAKAFAASGTPAEPGVAYFREESGTSMAAPHVAGAVAALLSTRREFIGRPEAVKAVLVASCVDLKRKADFQGAGLLDVLRAIQSV